jgi:hypothetical protein
VPNPGDQDISCRGGRHPYDMLSSERTFSIRIFGCTGFSRNACTGR